MRQLGLAYDGARRLRMLAPIREHVAAACPPSDDDVARVREHFATLLAVEAKRIGKRGGAEALARIKADRGNIDGMLGTFEGSLTENHREALVVQFTVAELTGVALPRTARFALEIAADEDAEPVYRGRVLDDFAQLAFARHELDAAQKALTHAFALYERAGSVVGLGNIEHSRGQIALFDGRLEDAERNFLASQRYFARSSETVVGPAACAAGLGSVHLLRNDRGTARLHFDEAARLYAAAGDEHGSAMAAARLGEVELALGNAEAAEPVLLDARRRFAGLGDRMGEANCAALAARAMVMRKRLAAAVEQLRAAYGRYVESSQALGLGNSLRIAAMAAVEAGDAGLAHALTVGALRAFEISGHETSIAVMRRAIAAIAATAGEEALQRAARVWQETRADELFEQLAATCVSAGAAAESN